MLAGDDSKRRSRGISTDMSPQAIARRIARASDLYDTWLALRGARRLGPVQPGAVAESPPEPWGPGPAGGGQGGEGEPSPGG
jgi:hypothetical protein